MHRRLEEPTAWPSDAGWLAWWRHQLTEVDALRIDADGRVTAPPPDGPMPLRLTRGEHLRPGAVYQAVLPGVSAAVAALGVDGTPDRRVVRGRFRTVADGKEATVALDSLDAPTSLVSSSDLAHLAWDLRFARSRAGLLTAEVRLDWLVAKVAADVVSAPGGTERLVVDVRVRGRGLWRPAAAPVLALLGRFMDAELTRTVADLAERLGTLESDPAGVHSTPEARERTRTRRVADRMNERAAQVERAVAARPWWRGRGRRAWATAYAALEAEAWPPRDSYLPTWAEEESRLHSLYSRRFRGEPATWIGDQIMEDLRRSQESVARARAAAARTPGPEDRLTDEMLDLSWLASPRRVMAKFRAAGAPAPEADGASATLSYS